MESSKEDIQTILDLAKRFLPTLIISKDDLTNIKVPFVIMFYHQYLNELSHICKELLDYNFEDIVHYCSHDVDQETFLFLIIRYKLHKIDIPYFNICDFFRPTNRTRTTMKFCLNFLFYIQENLPNAKAIVKGFYDKLESTDLKNKHILATKNEISSMSYNIGLDKEELERLDKEYEAEVKTNKTQRENDTLDEEIEQLEKKLSILTSDVSQQENELSTQNREFKLLSEQVEYEDYNLYEQDVRQLEQKIKEDETMILFKEQDLEKKHKELERLNMVTTHLQKIDLTPLDCVEEIHNFKCKIEEIISSKVNVAQYSEVFCMQSQNILQVNIDNEKHLQAMQNIVGELKGKCLMLECKLCDEQSIQKKMVQEFNNIKKQILDKKKACDKLEEYHNNLIDAHMKLYERFLAVQNSVTIAYNDSLE